MTIYYAQLISHAEDEAARNGISFPRAALVVMTSRLAESVGDLPDSLRRRFDEASRVWDGSPVEPPSFELERVECWRFLEAKNDGSSTQIADREDAAVRALICILPNEVPDEGDTYLTLEFFASMFE